MSKPLVRTGFIATLPDTQLTGTTQWTSSYGYRRSRLHTTPDAGGEGCWVSASDSIGQFIQADLGTVRRVEKIAIQGRGVYDMWVTSYKVAYSVDGLMYHFVVNYDGSERILPGNTDRSSVVETPLESAVAARFVRVYPQTWIAQITMRWEIYGCDIGKTHSELLCIIGEYVTCISVILSTFLCDVNCNYFRFL